MKTSEKTLKITLRTLRIIPRPLAVNKIPALNLLLVTELNGIFLYIFLVNKHQFYVKTMSTNADKKELIDWISKLSDSTMLEVIKSIKDSYSKTDWWDEISETEKEGIRRGTEDIKAGRIYSSEEFWEKIQQKRKQDL